jgi:hypothetical protein
MHVLVPSAPPAGFTATPGMECRVVCTPTGGQGATPQPNNGSIEALRAQLQALEALLPPQPGTGNPSPNVPR